MIGFNWENEVASRSSFVRLYNLSDFPKKGIDTLL